jgi:hypothetical protein
MLTKIISAAFATLTLVSNSNSNSNTTRPAMTAVIISDATRSAAWPRIVDLHDVTGHHRYYGSSACIRA